MSRFAHALGWLLPSFLLVLSIVAVPLLVTGERGLPRYRALREELAEIELGNERLRGEVRVLSREVERLRGDPEAIEQIARDELGMVDDEELVFQFAE